MLMIRIGIIGSESSGKSTLCKVLHERYGYRWIKEYARTYVEQLSRPYTYDDVQRIAQRQISEIKASYPEKVVLYDTELIITKVWMEHVYGKVAEEVIEALRAYPMDKYLLLAPDLPAEPDPVRENLDKRQYFFEWYEREIQATGVPYTVIRGEGETRIRNAYKAIQQ